MRKRHAARSFLLLLIGTVVPGGLASAESLHDRLETYRVKQAKTHGSITAWSRPESSTVPPLLGRPMWVAVAQIVPAPVPESAPAISRPGRTPDPEAPATPQAARARREITISTDLQYGFDSQKVLVVTPTPFLADVRRQIRNFVLTAQYPLAANTNLAVSVPYISQTTRGSTPGGSFRQSGRGVGDIGVFVQQRFPEIARGTELDVTLGMLMPTGKDPFNLQSNELPTGLGFYQPTARVRISKLRVPLQLYAALDYGTSLSRTVNGRKTRLPASYGAELGFYYSLSPEFTAQTAFKWSRISSPFVFENSSNVGYLSQSLIYNSGANTSLQASVDAGLTEDALDFFLSLSLVNSF